MSTVKRVLDFIDQKFFIGLDVHDRFWKVTIRCNGMPLKTFSMNPSPPELAQYMTKHYPGGSYYSVYEAGFCGFWVHRELCALGFHNIVINPADVPTSGKEKTNKNDKRDSRKLARELENGSLEAIYVPTEPQQQRRSLCRLRFRTVENCKRVKNRLKGLLHYYGYHIPSHTEMPHWSGKFIQWLKALKFAHAPGNDYLQFALEELANHRQRLTAITRQLRRYSREPELAPTFQCLHSVSGIGFITAITLLTELIDMARFKTFDDTACFVGLIPSEHSTGGNDNSAGITSRRNKYLRPLLIEAAWVAVREDPAMTQAFHQLTKRMTPQRAIIRMAKKLLRRIRHVWLNQTPYVTAVVQ
jgi:transposase